MTGLVGSEIAVPQVRPLRRPARESVVRRLLLHAGPTTWAYFDFLLIMALTTLAHRMLASGLLWGGPPAYRWILGPWLSALSFSACFTLAGLVFGLYERRTLEARGRIVVRSVLTLGLGLVLGYASILLFFYGTTTRWLGLLIALMYVMVAVPVRLLAHEAVTSHRSRILCVGSGDSIRRVVGLLRSAARPHLEVVGYVRVPHAEPNPGSSRSPAETYWACPCLGSLDDIEQVLERHEIDQVVVGSELAADPEVGTAVLRCLDRHRRVTDQPTFVEKLLGEVPAENINAQWFLIADFQAGSGYEAVKRAVDVLVALLGLLLSLPLALLIALAIKLDSPGPVLFRQKRVGLHGRIFTIYKFRTMQDGAEANGARWADPRDPRVTRIGRFLRLSRLDELPQLWNILKGDMSLVGPRPERPEFVEQLSHLIPHYRQRHLIKPGLTGWAQIHFGYGASVEDAQRKLGFDLYYLKHRSIDLDFAILIRTLGTFLLGAR